MSSRGFIVISILIAIVLVLAGCAEFMQARGRARKIPRYPDALTEDAVVAFRKAEDAYFAGRYDEAKDLYEVFIDTYGYNELTDEARFKLGEIAFLRDDFKSALEYYRSAYEKLYNPKIAPKAQFKAAASYSNLGRDEEAASLLDKMERGDMSAILRIRADSLAARTKARLNYPLSDMVVHYLFLLDDYSDYTGDAAALKRIKERLVTEAEAKANVKVWIDDKTVTASSIERLPLKSMEGKASGGYAFYKLGVTFFNEGDIKKAARYLGKFVSGYPKSEYYNAALQLYQQVKSYEMGVRQYKIGVILPLSGRYAVFGKNTLHGIECAAGVVPPCVSQVNVQIVTRDSRGSAEAAVAAVRELVNEEEVVAIIGDMMGNVIEEEAYVAQELGVPMISLSQKESVANIGDYIFSCAMGPESQVNALVKYAIEKRGLRDFGIMYPEDSYGRNFRNLFRTAVERYGGNLVGEKGYYPQAFFGYVEAKPEARVDVQEGRSQMRPEPRRQRSGVVDGLITSHAFAGVGQHQLSMRGSSMSTKPPEYHLPPGEAVFIPDSYKNVARLVSYLVEKGRLGGQLLMGTNRWDNPEFAVRGGSGVEGAVFVDGFFKESPDVTTRTFVQSFVQAFNIEPTVLEAQAYDATRLLLQAIKRGGAKRSRVKEALLRTRNFPGATGTITVLKNGQAYRDLHILTIKGGGIVEVPEASSESRKVVKRSDAAALEKYEGYVPKPVTLGTRREIEAPEAKYEPIIE